MYQKREVSLPVGTKQQNLKQETGNDYDVISGLKVFGKTDFCNIFSFSYKQSTFVQFLGKLIKLTIRK